MGKEEIGLRFSYGRLGWEKRGISVVAKIGKSHFSHSLIFWYHHFFLNCPFPTFCFLFATLAWLFLFSLFFSKVFFFVGVMSLSRGFHAPLSPSGTASHRKLYRKRYLVLWQGLLTLFSSTWTKVQEVTKVAVIGNSTWILYIFVTVTHFPSTKIAV